MPPLDDESLQNLTRDVWDVLLGIEAKTLAGGTTGDESIVTAVDISGAWEGTVFLSLPAALAPKLASAMLACDEHEASSAIVQDVVRELANVIGGHVKGMLPGPCKLSLPRVERPLSEGAGTGRRLWFDCAGHPFCITVRSRAAEKS